ncbi:MAG TPA: energy transducer TonB [Gammaproteobacteria bacterium]|nr:energy transducer TonB [Gammaproteobacteria bacterium]
MNVLKIPIAVIFGGLFTTLVFWLLAFSVNQGERAGALAEAKRIDFSRVRKDTEVQTKRQEKVQRERPPPTPQTPRMALSQGGLDNNVASLSPIVDTRGAMKGLKLSAGSDRDVVPLVRISPEYPQRALTRGLEGWVKVQFTITTTGTVKDPLVVDADPKNIFDDAALKSIARWKYNPKVEDGVAVERIGVQTIIRFQLEQ